MDRFKTRLGFIIAGLGMAVGAGNIWRFPRVATQNGGGNFILAWAICLFLWSLPLLIIEIGMGRSSKKGLIGAFKEFAGEKFSWMGTFVAFVSTAIMFYYTVVTGWFLRYFLYFTFRRNTVVNTESLWNDFISGNSLKTFWQSPFFFQLLALLLTATVVYFGIAKGIEKANSFLIPSLFILLIIAAFNVAFLPGFGRGVDFLFSFKLDQLFNHKVWMNALSQSAWSTGAGWGLILTYSVYTTRKEDPVVSSTVIALGNNSASLLAALIIVPTIFTFNSISASMEIMKSGNQGFAFIHLPILFLKMPAGNILIIIFFLALFFAAFSSLISLLELPVRVLMDFGIKRKRAIIFVASLGFILGLPSALDIRIFNNQDWVWSLGLMLSGFFFALAIIKFKVEKFRKEIINPFSSIKLNRFFNIIVKFIIPIEFILMIVWWFLQSSGNILAIFQEYSLGTTLFQWGVFLLVFILFNKKILRYLK